MTRQNKSPPAQISMFDAFDRAEQDAKTAHLPGGMAAGIEYYRGLIERHHAAILRCDVEEARKISDEAHDLAYKLNNGDSGILAGPEASGCILEMETAAPTGDIPMYGQLGDFVIDVDGTPVRIDMEGIFGISKYAQALPGFAIHAVDWQKPFFSPTGYRSFLGYRVHFTPGMMPDELVREAIREYARSELKGKLRPIKSEYIERHAPEPQL